MSAAATSESLLLVSRAKAVKGKADQASASPVPRRRPEMDHPRANMPAMQRTSKSVAAPCAAGRESHVPSQGWASSKGTYEA